MNIIDLLIYKNDNESGLKRISKTKTISLIVFIAFFLFAMSIYTTNPEVSPNIFASLFAALLVGLAFAVPVFILGWIVGKFLNRDKSTSNISPVREYDSSDNHGNYEKTMPIEDVSNPENYAPIFKKAIDDNDSDLANNILSKWDADDANYMYAKIIFDGMPPSNMELHELNDWLHKADNMKSHDENLSSWFRNTAIQVINMHK